jgi:hypothetical protein
MLKIPLIFKYYDTHWFGRSDKEEQAILNEWLQFYQGTAYPIEAIVEKGPKRVKKNHILNLRLLDNIEI